MMVHFYYLNRDVALYCWSICKGCGKDYYVDSNKSGALTANSSVSELKYEVNIYLYSL